MSVSPFQRPNDTSTGGAGGGAFGGRTGGNGRVAIQATPRARAFPWPLPYSAQQGGVGGAGGSGRVSVNAPPYYRPFQSFFPYGIPNQLVANILANPVRL